MEMVNWGIIGLGGIANKFAMAVEKTSNAKVIACASNTYDKSKKFADKYNLQYSYNKYDEMMKNPDIDAIYISNVHNMHYESAKLCLENNKHVLCEKAFTINSIQANELMELAKKNNLFIMEAMWTRFLPVNRWAFDMVKNNEIGEVSHIEASYGFKFKFDANSRAFNINLAGGGLLDLGIYPLSFVSMFMGAKPVRINSITSLGETGVDEKSNVTLLFENSKTASIGYSMLYKMENKAIIYGSKGKIVIDDYVNAQKATLLYYDGRSISCDMKHENGFIFEVNDATQAIINQKTESSIMPIQETVEILKICDVLRKECGLIYPQEL